MPQEQKRTCHDRGKRYRTEPHAAEIKGPHSSGAEKGSYNAHASPVEARSQGVDGQDGENAHQGRNETERRRRTTEQRHAERLKVDEQRLAAVVRFKEDRPGPIQHAQGVKPVVGFVSVKARRQCAKGIEAQARRQRHDQRDD